MSTRTESRLASDSRAGTFARRKARLEQRAYLRRNWRFLLGGYVALVAIGSAPLLSGQGSDFFRGLWLGWVVAGVGGALITMVVIQTGTGPTMAGELAEQWTAQELRPLTKRGYRLANHVNVDYRGDVDHVLIGPSGCLILETKWSATEWRANDRNFEAAIRQLKRRARSTWLQLKPTGVPSVTPVLVLWGKAAEPLRSGTGVKRDGDVLIVRGDHLRRWLLSRAGGALDAATIDAAFAKLSKIALHADKVDAPVPPSVARLFSLLVTAASVWVATLLASLWALRYGWPAYGAVAIGLAAVGAVLWQRGSRWLGSGAAIGAASSLLFTGGAVAYAFLVA